MAASQLGSWFVLCIFCICALFIVLVASLAAVSPILLLHVACLHRVVLFIYIVSVYTWTGIPVHVHTGYRTTLAVLYHASVSYDVLLVVRILVVVDG